MIRIVRSPATAAAGGRSPIRRIGGTLLLVVLAATSLLRDATAMPPPARGNTRGLSPHVREMLRQNPGLFYPRQGFRDVIERQKLQRRQVVSNLLRSGRTRAEAELEAASRVTTTRYCPVLCGRYSDKLTPDWPVGDLVGQLFSLDYGATNPLGQPGSMREHYRDMSYGSFDVQGGCSWTRRGNRASIRCPGTARTTPAVASRPGSTSIASRSEAGGSRRS